jgi:hypothetical protein
VFIKIFGTKGAILYSGNDQDPNSGKLEWSRGDEHSEWVGISEIQCPELGFQFEELDQSGCGPESMQVSDTYHGSLLSLMILTLSHHVTARLRSTTELCTCMFRS